MSTFKAAYVGDAEGDIEAFGVTFAEGETTDVAERYRAKIENNPFFEISGAGASKDASTSQPVDAPEGPYEAKEKSPGWWAIYGKDGKEIGKAMRKDDAEAFAAMTDEDKTAYVKSEIEKL